MTPSCPSCWRDDAPQVICSSYHHFCTVLSFLASSFATFSNASCFLSKAHSVAFASTLKIPSYSSKSPRFNAKKAYSIILGVQSVSSQTLSLVPSIPWPAIHVVIGLVSLPAFLFSAPSRNFFAVDLSQEKYSHIPRMYWSSSSILHNIPRCAVFSTTGYHCHFVNGLSPSATRILL